jgi:hypothetical protein
MQRIRVSCKQISMGGLRELLASVNAISPAPYFHLVAGISQGVASANSGVVIDMFSAVHGDCLIPLHDPDLVIVHGVSPISGMAFLEWGSSPDATRVFCDF